MMKKLHFSIALLLMAVCSAVNAQTFYESFDKCSGTGGNDDTWKGITNQVAMTDEKFDNEGWTFTDLKEGSKCVYFAKNDNGATATTPALGITGAATLTFKAEAWGTDTGNFYVKISGNGTFDDGNTTVKVTLPKKGTTDGFAEYTLNIKGMDAETKIVFQAEKKKRTFLDEVKIEAAAAEPTTITYTPAKAKTTFCSDYDLDFSEVDGLTAYAATSYANGYVTFTKVEKAKAGEGLVIEATAGTEYTISVTEGATAVEGNLLKGATEDKVIAADDNIYLLSDGEFVKANAGTLAKGKAYLVLPEEAPAKVGINFDGTTTAISSIKVAENANAPMFNLAGQRVGANYKGVVIQNGVKKIQK